MIANFVDSQLWEANHYINHTSLVNTMDLLGVKGECNSPLSPVPTSCWAVWLPSSISAGEEEAWDCIASSKYVLLQSLTLLSCVSQGGEVSAPGHLPST